VACCTLVQAVRCWSWKGEEMTRDDIIRMAREAGSIDSEEVIETVYSAFGAAERNRMIADGWRQCAKGQRTTQFCGLFETKERRND
jgi:hypothetical protein